MAPSVPKKTGDFKAEVTSSNTVGYQKIVLTANKMSIVAPQFQDVAESTMDVQNLTASAEFSLEGGDWIKIYDPYDGLYTELRWWGLGNLYENADAEEPLPYAGWGDKNQNVASATVSPGQGLWVKSVAGGTVLAKGEVVSSGEITVPVNKMALVANPFPVEISIQRVIASADFSLEGGDWIKIYDPSDGLYTELRWWGLGNLYENADAEEPLPYAGWGDKNQNVASATIYPGQGFWVKSVAGGTLTFPNPFAPVESND